MGERAVLAEVGSLADVLALHAALRASRPTGVRDLVPAARTVLVTVDPAHLSLAAARAWIERVAAEEGPGDASAPMPGVEVPIRYDGADLADTAALVGLSAEALVARHRCAEWTVAFAGFAPGFAYLVSADWPFEVPRLDSPRTRVPAGSVGLAGGFSGAYPRATPGGWRLIGTTDAVLFDPASDTPALLPPGTRVRFVEDPPRRIARPLGTPEETGPATARRRGEQSSAPAAVEVVESGPLSTVQDLGREGRASLGVSRSGALDRGALRLANRLVGNAEDAAAIEVTLGGFRAVAGRDLWIAVTGAWGAATVDDRPLDRNVATRWPAGTPLTLQPFTAGARAMIAVRGGVEVTPVAGSRSTDILAGLGPAPLTAGDRLVIGPDPSSPVPVTDLAPWSAAGNGPIEIDLAPGPRAEWFAPDARATLFDAEWTVTAQADRVGIRLDGPELIRARGGEVPSEGMVPGALQVPPTGRPVVLLADGPATGGYPVIAVVTDAALDALAQARPGTRLRFRHARREG